MEYGTSKNEVKLVKKKIGKNVVSVSRARTGNGKDDEKHW